MSQEVQPGAVIIGPSLHEDRAVERAMLEAGANGCLSKQSPAKEVIEVLHRACRRDTVGWQGRAVELR